MNDETAILQALIDAAGVMGRVILEDRNYYAAGTLELREFVEIKGGQIITTARVGVHIGAEVNGARLRTPLIYRPPCEYAVMMDKDAGSTCQNRIDWVIQDRPGKAGPCFFCERDPHDSWCPAAARREE